LARGIWLRWAGCHIQHGTGDIESRLSKQGFDPPIFVFILKGTCFDPRLRAELFGIEGQLGQHRVEAVTIILGR
jgi:hypothetical protein